MNCDFIAPHYQTLEYVSFGRALERRRFAFLSEAKASRKAILCGGGDGRFLARLLGANSAVCVDFVDSSRKMVELADRRISAMGRSFRARVRFHVADLENFHPSQDEYDLIATHFFLDCFTDSEVAALTVRLASWTAPDAQWIVSEFQQPEGWFAGLWTRLVIRALYAAFRIAANLQVAHLPSYESALANAGFRPQRKELALGGLLHSSLWRRLPSHLKDADFERN
ncbi:MAG TPA: class I SAM-dependent methyltransferase [Candidatus Acidoferrum sp.]